VTASPLLGDDALEPLIAAARAAHPQAGVFVLVRTSNPGAADVEDVPTVADDGSRAPLWEQLARRVDALGVEAVTGATAPEHLPRMRELMPRAVFLLPGVGAQGGRVEALGPAFASGPAGGLVTVSRGIALAHEQSGGEPADAARAAAERLRNEVWDLAGGG
jgi:orotidine-5'-phosphate decarboxylase